VHADLETLAVALYVKVDDELKARPELAPPRPAGGIAPKLSDAELVTMAVMQALLMFRSERRWLRYMRKHLRGLFPYQLKQAGYNKRLRSALPLIKHVIRTLARLLVRQSLGPGFHTGGVRQITAHSEARSTSFQLVVGS